MSNVNYSLKVIATIFVIVFLCIACEKGNIEKSLAKMYDDGIERIQKAEEPNDVQKIYDDVTKKVEDFEKQHLKEFTALDSKANALKKKSEEHFIKVCCIKLYDMKDCLKTAKGVVCADKNGNLMWAKVVCEGDSSPTSAKSKPFNIIDMIPIYGSTQVDDEVRYHFDRVKMMTSNGEYLYDDEQMENAMLYMHYFFMSYLIAKNGVKYASYLKDHLFDVVCNLPLDESYPQDIREYANKIYYNNKDKMSRMVEYDRGYGYVEFVYDKGFFFGQNLLLCFKLYRDDDTGKLMSSTTFHSYNPRTAY